MTGRLRRIACWLRGFGEGRVADALLAKWLADPEADGAWHRLLDDMIAVRQPRARLRAVNGGRPPRTAVALWWLSLGLSEAAVAEHMGISVDTVKTYVQRARRELGVTGGTQPHLIATAIRRGVIP